MPLLLLLPSDCLRGRAINLNLNYCTSWLTPMSANRVTKVIKVSTKRPLTIFLIFYFMRKFGLDSKPAGFLFGSRVQHFVLHLAIRPSLTMAVFLTSDWSSRNSSLTGRLSYSIAFYGFSPSVRLTELLVNLASSTAIAPSLLSRSRAVLIAA